VVISFLSREKLLKNLLELENLIPDRKRIQAKGLLEASKKILCEGSHREIYSSTRISAVFAYKRARERFSISRPADIRRVEIHGWENICKVLNLKESSMRVKLSHGKGKFEHRIPQVKDNPVTVHRLGLLPPGDEPLPFNPKCLDIFCD
jgi:hypothetical protein